MPVLPVFADAALGPARTRVIGEAFDRAIGLLDIVPLKIVQEVMASRIIKAAQRGERDVDRLVEVALAGTGHDSLRRINARSPIFAVGYPSSPTAALRQAPVAERPIALPPVGPCYAHHNICRRPHLRSRS
jgi:hypothetical protein